MSMDPQPFLHLLTEFAPRAQSLVLCWHLRIEADELINETAIGLIRYCGRHESLRRGDSQDARAAFVERALFNHAKTQLLKQRNDERIQSLVAEPKDHRTTATNSDLSVILDVFAEARDELGLNGEFALAVILDDSTPAKCAKKMGIKRSTGAKRYTRGIRVLRRILTRELDCGFTRTAGAEDDAWR